MKLTAKQIDQTFDELVQATAAHYRATEQELTTKLTLETAVAEGLANGTIDGKNEQLRQAKAREMLADLYAAYEDATTAARLSRLKLEVAKLEMERVKTMIRVKELNSLSVLRIR